MKPLYECEWCSFRSTMEIVENHERHCKYNPKNIEIKDNKEIAKERKEVNDTKAVDDTVPSTKELKKSNKGKER